MNRGVSMKKLLFVFYLFVFLLGSISIASAETLYYVGRGQGSMGIITFFLDNDSVRKNNNTAVVWLKLVYENGNFSYQQTKYTRYDRTAQTIYASSFFSNNVPNHYVDFDPRIRPIHPNSMDEAILYLIW